MEDLFEREQAIADAAFSRIKDEMSCTLADYTNLAKEYRRLLKQARLVTKISDRTTVDLNTRKLDLQEMVLLDKLTGIYNRRFLDENMERLLRSLVIGRGMLSVLMVDVDFFKQYNDTYGHEKGDECLQTVARAVNSSIQRNGDFVARYGGEEFVIVLPNTDGAGARFMASRVLETIRGCGIPHEQSAVADKITVSVGVTSGTVEPVYTSEDYIRIADIALYQSKKNGRDRCTFIKLEEEL